MDKSRVHHPPAFCPVHGLFPATAIALHEGSMQNMFIGSTTSCPTCGRRSEIIPGIYDALPGRLHVRIDPSISPSALQAIRSIAERLKREEITPEEALEEAQKINPQLAHLLKIAVPLGAWAISTVLIIIGLYFQIQGNNASSADAAAIRKAIETQTAFLENYLVQDSEQKPNPQIKAAGEKEAKPKTKPKLPAKKPEDERQRRMNRSKWRAVLRRQGKL